MAGQGHDSITGDGDGAGDLSQIAQLVLDLEADPVDAGVQGNVVAGQNAAGNVGIHGNTVNQNNAGGVVQAGIVCDLGGECHGSAGDLCAILQSHGLVGGGVGDITDGGQDSIVHSRGVVQSDVIDVEGDDSRFSGLDVGTGNGGRTGVGLVVGIGSSDVVVGSQVDGSIDPARLGDISLGAGIQVLHGAISGGEGEVSLLAGGFGGIELGLEGQTGSILRDVQPHTQLGCILAVGHVTQNDLLTNVEQNIIGPACEAGISIVKAPCQRILAVLDLTAHVRRGQERGGADLLVELTANGIRTNQSVVDTVVDGPLLGIHKAHPAVDRAVLEVEEDLGALAEGDGDHIGLGCVGDIGRGDIHTGDGLIGGSDQDVALQHCGVGVAEGQLIGTVNAYPPAVRAVRGGDFQLGRFAVGDHGGIGGEAKGIGMDDVDKQLAHYSLVADQLHGDITDSLPGGEDAILDEAHAFIIQLPGDIGRDLGRIAACVNTGDSDSHRSAGSDVAVIGLHNGVIKDTGGGSLRDDHDGVDGRTLGAVGGDGAHHVFSGAFTLGDKGRGAAAVAVDSIDAAQGQHHLAHLVVAQAGGGGGIAAVHLTEDQRSIGLDADHRPGSVRGGALNAGGGHGTILDQPAEVGGDGGPLVAIQGGGHGAQLSSSIGIDGQVGLCALVDLGSTQDHTVPDHIAVGSVGVVGQSGVHGTDYIVTQGVLIVGNGLGQLLGLPDGGVAGQIIGVQLVDAVVAGNDLDLVIGGVHLEDVDHLPVGAVGIVQDDLLLNRTGGQIVNVTGNDIVVSVRHRGVKIGHCLLCGLSGRCGHGQHANNHHNSQNHRDHTGFQRMIHLFSS